MSEIRVRATLSVREGSVALYLREREDLRATAHAAVGISQPDGVAAVGDRFDGYRRIEARPGEPVIATGEAAVLGSHVVVWLEATSGPAAEIELVLDPV